VKVSGRFFEKKAPQKTFDTMIWRESSVGYPRANKGIRASVTHPTPNGRDFDKNQAAS
jgi:hypothetical protein